ncbi:MAG TPA: ABC transporter permease [Ilumatobacteraceae bacterium]|jgi:putative ABC transport system permease protein
MARSVPLARRNLLAEPRRLIASAAGVGMAIMLILLLDGLWAGIKANVTTYEDNVGADLYVAQRGTRNFFGAISLLPLSTVDTVRADPDVDWAVPVRGFFSIVELHNRKVPAYVIGSVPGERGGPWELRDGRAPTDDNEVAIGSVMAKRHGLAVGDRIEIMGRVFTIVGTGTDAFMATFVFMTHAATDQLLSAPATTSFVLVGTDDPAAVRDRLGSTGLSVLDRDELARNDLSLMARAYSVPLTIMRSVAFTIGSLVIALTVYTAIMERRREYGIVKAMGARGRHLFTLAVHQTLIIASVGLAAGGLLFLIGRAYITWARPQFVILASPAGVGRAVAAAVLMALVAAVLPARRLARLEPAVAYRGG